MAISRVMQIYLRISLHLESATVTKVSPAGKNYTVGQEISVSGDSYNYPDSFDVIVFRDRVAVCCKK